MYQYKDEPYVAAFDTSRSTPRKDLSEPIHLPPIRTKCTNMTGLPASRKSNITEDAGLEKERLEYVVEKEEELLLYMLEKNGRIASFRWQRRSRRVRFALCQAFLKFSREKSFWRRIDRCPFVWIWNVAMEARRNKIFIIREKIAVLRKNFPQEIEK